MKILTFSSLYPNERQPNHGLFVEHRLRNLLADTSCEAHVVAAVPWFPFANERFGDYAVFASVPRREVRNGIPCEHPRYLTFPKIGMAIQPWSMARAALGCIRSLIRRHGSFDLIDAHYLYPDGVAAAIVARKLDLPLVLTARGTDVNVIARMPGPRRKILAAISQAQQVITVSEGLRQSLIAIGAPADRIATLRNGVDLNLFQPMERDAVRDQLDLHGPTLISVGTLVEAKGHHFCIEALTSLTDATLIIAGKGAEEQWLKGRVRKLGVEQRVRFVGVLPQTELRRYYSAADTLVLASRREGWANVLLEAMACGTPAIGSDIPGMSEVIASPSAGEIMPERSTEALLHAYRKLHERGVDRQATRRYAEGFSWHETSTGQMRIFESVVSG